MSEERLSETGNLANEKERRNRRWFFASSGRRTVIVVLCALLIILIVVGLNDYNATPRMVEDITPPETQLEPYQYSNEQQEIIDTNGYPDSFTLLFYDDTLVEDDVQTTRFETWAYFSEGIQITFVNGETLQTTDLAINTDVYQSPYQPNQFTAYMGLNDILAVTEVDSYMIIPLEKELIPDGDIFYANQLAFGLKDDHLLYLETLAFYNTEDE
jgi:hypothetical protein